MKSRLGCLSTSGAVAAVIVLLGVLGWALLAGPTPFSPGALNAEAKTKSYGGVSTHAQLGSRCAACHTAPWSSQTMADKCLECHTEVASQISGKTGLHGRLVGKLASPTCKGCHTEHHGGRATLTTRDPGSFPHDLTRFSLRGHLRSDRFTLMRCEDCHPKDLTTFDAAACSDCHARLDSAFMARHEASYGRKCLLCHDGKGGDATFDHNTLPFKLTGKHAGVKCEKCHASGSLVSAASTPRECVACHAKNDKHSGAFGQKCDDCHSVNGWPGATFDHSLFPVNHGQQGGQASECKTCHPNGTSSYDCYGCHEHTVGNVLAQHGGKTPAQLADCVQCHKGGAGGG